MPELTADLSEDEAQAVKAKRDEMLAEQVRLNVSAILDALLDEHPEETLEVLALCCFVEPENVDDFPVSAYLRTVTELLQDENVMDFFSLLASLVK